ncbi:MAG: ABC transporter ATP-binding protein [Nitrososphaerales archaeon]
MDVVETAALVKRFSKVTALDGVSFGVGDGAVTGLIGPNGSGKTTTIKVILGLLRPDEGEARLFGEDPWDNPRALKRVGVIQEKPRFPQNIKVRDYLSRVARMHGHPSSRADELLRAEGLVDCRDRAVGKLSAGMLQRFALAHALIDDPEVVVADEPTSNLDPQARGEVLRRILELNKEGRITFLISSHLLPELSRVCDTAVIMRAGRIVASGELEKLYETFRSEVVRVTTDKPGDLAERIRELKYVVGLEVSGENIVVEAQKGSGDRLYDDVPGLARQVGARLYGVESKNASLEELFRRATSPDGEQH